MSSNNIMLVGPSLTSKRPEIYQNVILNASGHGDQSLKCHHDVAIMAMAPLAGKTSATSAKIGPSRKGFYKRFLLIIAGCKDYDYHFIFIEMCYISHNAERFLWKA